MKQVIALGFFDGVHIGHAALLTKASAALTFDVPPETAITGRALPLVCSVSERVSIMKNDFGIDDVIVLPFTDMLARMPWQSFVDQVLVREYGVSGVVVGDDFRFGYLGSGTAQKLARHCRESALTCEVIPRVTLDGIVVSSTMIRTLIAQGAVDEAARFLGRPYGFALPVVKGRQRGKRLGFPTVNSIFPKELQAPKAGVYKSQVAIDQKIWKAITNIGTRPTFDDDDNDSIIAETHILGYECDLYGCILRVDLLQFMRPEIKFASAEKLQNQVMNDMEEAQL